MTAYADLASPAEMLSDCRALDAHLRLAPVWRLEDADVVHRACTCRPVTRDAARPGRDSAPAGTGRG